MSHRVATYKNGKQFVIWYDEAGKRHRRSLGTTDKYKATAIAGQVVASQTEKTEPTVGQIVERYLEKTEAIGKEILRYHWKRAAPTFAALRVEHVTGDVCRTYALSRKAKPGTIRKELGVVRSGLGWAKREGIIANTTSFWMPAEPPPRDRRLSREEFERLEIRCYSSPHLLAFVRIARFTGARAGAILALLWDNIDFDKRMVHFGGTVRQKRRATVPMHPDLAWTLILAKEAAETDHVIEWAGKPVKSIKNAFRRAVAQAGLGKEVTPHVLRHTAASWMAEAGIPMAEIAAVLGHSDPSTTFRIYAKFSPDYLQKAVRALG